MTTAAKNENVSWLLMRSPLSQEVTWPAATRVLSRGKRRNSRSEIVEKSNFSDVPPRATSIRKRNAAGVKWEMVIKPVRPLCCIFLLAFSRGHDGAQRSMTFLSFYLFLFVCLLLFFLTQIKNVALICSINFWTENKGLRTVKELPT